jgi:S-adenosylmethionine:tRNA ribosyltransferase-isomerase
VRTSEFEYQLPAELIAQHPTPRRDDSRLLVVQRNSGQVSHRRFPDLLEYLRNGDLVVLNNSKVIPARLRGLNARSGGEFELLLLEENSTNDWWAMMRPGKRARLDTKINLRDHSGATGNISGTVIDTNEEGHRRLKFSGTPNILEELPRLGEIPLPPYIKRESQTEWAQDTERYQTIYAEPRGSVAAPTAGLHFTPELLERIRAGGIRVCSVTLHVGLGTFAPVKTERLEQHVMHSERYEIPPDTAVAINEAKLKGHRVIAVGTTSLRVLESAPRAEKGILPGAGTTNLFIHPPYQFKVVDALLTNFHLPCSTLLVLVGAFAAPGETRGRDVVLSAYREAIRERYRFFSYGDAMFLE